MTTKMNKFKSISKIGMSFLLGTCLGVLPSYTNSQENNYAQRLIHFIKINDANGNGRVEFSEYMKKLERLGFDDFEIGLGIILHKTYDSSGNSSVGLEDLSKQNNPYEIFNQLEKELKMDSRGENVNQ